MSDDVNVAIKAASIAISDGAQAMADATGTHVELVLGMFGVVYYHYYHPPTCPERDKPKELPAHDDIPDVFKKLWEDGGTAEEPKPEGGA